MENNNLLTTDKLSNNSISTDGNLTATRSKFGTTRQIPEIHDIDCVCSTCILVCSTMDLFEWFARYENPSLPTVNGIIDQLYEVRDDCMSRYIDCNDTFINIDCNTEVEYMTETIGGLILQAETQENYRGRPTPSMICKRSEPVSISKIISLLYEIHGACETVDNTGYIANTIWSLIQQVE